MTTVAYATRIDGSYRVGDRRLPSITSVLAPIKPEYPPHPRYMQRGSLVHLAMQAQIEGTVGDAYVDEWCEWEIGRNGYCLQIGWVLPYVTSAINWCADHVVRARRTETPGANLTLGYAGTPDIDGGELVDDSGLWLIDGKTQDSVSPSPWFLAQIAMQARLETVAYANGCNEPYGARTAYGSLLIGAEGAQLRTWTQAQVDDALWRCVTPLLWMRAMDAGALSLEHIPGSYDMARLRRFAESNLSAWLSERRKAGYFPERVRPKTARRSAAAVRAARNAEAFGFTEVHR